jgi:hypothetical protein
MPCCMALIKIITMTWCNLDISAARGATSLVTSMSPCCSMEKVFRTKRADESLFATLVIALEHDADAPAKLKAVLDMVPACLFLHEIATVQTVRLVVASKWPVLFVDMRTRALQDVRRSFMGCIAAYKKTSGSPPTSLFAYTREFLLRIFDMEVMCMQDMLAVGLDVLAEHLSDAAVMCIGGLFGHPYLFPESALDVAIIKIIERSDNCTALTGALQRVKASVRGAEFCYARLDLSAAKGSCWLRELVLGMPLDAEETAAAAERNVALVSRWTRFVFVKRLATKRAVLLAEVDGENLVQFAIRRAAVCCSMGRVLVDFIMYMIMVEHPGMLDGRPYCELMLSTHALGLQDVYFTALQGLIRRTQAAFTSGKLGLLKVIVECGMPADQIVPILSQHPIRDKDTRTWRKHLHHCLKLYGTDMNYFLENHTELI